MEERTVEARTTVYGHDPTSATLTTHAYESGERLRRALRAAGPWLLGALASLPIPGWHFVGVPGCLIAAFLQGRRKLREVCEIVGLATSCPACAAEQSLPAPVSYTDELTWTCDACREFLTARPAEASLPD